MGTEIIDKRRRVFPPPGGNIESFLAMLRGYLKRPPVRQSIINTLQSMVAIVLALAVGAVLILVVGENPLNAYAALLKGAFGSLPAIARTLRVASPLIFTGLSVAVAFRAGIINLGTEGSLYLGALTAALTGIYLVRGLPDFLHLPLALLAGTIAGGLWSLLPGYLRARWRVDEIVSTLMLNYVAVLLVDYLVYTYFQDPIDGATSERAITVLIPPAARLPFLSEEYGLTASLLIGVALVVLFSWLYRRSIWGFESDMAGLNRRFAHYGGVDTFKIALSAMIVSGMLGGLAGATEILGIYGRYIGGFSTGLGFDGITVALMGRLSPVGILFSALFFGALKNGGASMELAVNVPRDIVVVIQGLILLIVTAQVLFMMLRLAWRARPEE